MCNKNNKCFGNVQSAGNTEIVVGLRRKNFSKIKEKLKVFSGTNENELKLKLVIRATCVDKSWN